MAVLCRKTWSSMCLVTLNLNVFWKTGLWMGVSFQFSSVAQLCLMLYDPMDCSTLALPVHHQLPEFTQIHVHWVGDAIWASNPLSSPSPPAFNFSQHQGLIQGVSSSHQVAKVLEFQLQHKSFQWIPRTDFLWDWLIGSPCTPRDCQESSPIPQFKSIIYSVLSFLLVQLSHPYMTTGKTIALTRWTFVGKAMFLLFNMLSRLVITSFKEQTSFNFMAAITICSDFGAQENKVCHCFHCFPTYLLWSNGTECHDLSFLYAEF